MNPYELTLQSDAAGRLNSIPYFSDLSITLESEGFTESDVAKALGPMLAGGKAEAQRGTLILIKMTREGAHEKTPNAPGPQESYELTIRVLQIPKVARLRAGYKTYAHVSRAIKQACHLWQIGTAPVVFAGSEPYNDGEGTIGKDIVFHWQPAPEVARPCVQATISVSPDGSLVLACNNPDADVYATFDGSYPAPVADNAMPVNLPADRKPSPGQLVRVVAYAPGLLPSGITEKQF